MATPIDIAALLAEGGTLFGVAVSEVVVRTVDGREQRLQLPISFASPPTCEADDRRTIGGQEAEPLETDTDVIRDLIQWIKEQEKGHEFTADEAARGAGYAVPASGPFREACRIAFDRKLVTKIPGNRGYRIV